MATTPTVCMSIIFWWKQREANRFNECKICMVIFARKQEIAENDVVNKFEYDFGNLERIMRSFVVFKDICHCYIVALDLMCSHEVDYDDNDNLIFPCYK